MKRIVVVIAILFGCAPAVPAQDCTQTVPFNVVDEKTGVAVVSLRPEMFQARLGEMAIPIASVQAVEKRRILLLVDESGSMERTNKLGSHQKEALQVTEDALTQMLAQLPGGLSVSYGVFNDKAAFADGFFTDPKQLQQAIAETRQKLPKLGRGGTALFDALLQAAARFDTPQVGDAILLLSDGGENRSKATEGKFEKEFRRSGLRLALLWVNQHENEYVEPLIPTVTNLARATGGAVGTIDINDASWITAKDSAANRLALRKFWTEEVLSGYALKVQVPASFSKPKKWKVQLNGVADRELKHVALQYPEKLAPCPVSTAAVH
ncbi:MAG TPA: vWA domain-containing protein [Candidatus Angelobacter sp.]|nr:vWA domain-containing protein [Candidatus Angelobacter sp.]